MYGLTDLRKDTLIQIDGVPYRVVEYQHTQLGRGGAVVRTKLKNLLDGRVLTKTFKGNDKIQPTSLDKVSLQYLYKEAAQLMLMDKQSYDQLSVSVDVAGSAADLLPEGSDVTGWLFNGKLVGLDVPTKLKLKVADTEPGFKGDTTGSAQKPAKLETGAQINVPLFIKSGDQIIVDSRTRQYVERAK